MPSTPLPTGTGATINATTSTDLQTAFFMEIAQSVANTPSSAQIIYTPTSQPRQSIAVNKPITIDLPYGIDTITGTAAVTVAQVLLDSPGDTYVTDLTGVSTVVAADNIGSTIVNNNVAGGLIAVTGAGQNLIEGLAGANQIITGTGGIDNVVLNGGANSLTSNGIDTIQVGGPSTVTAAAGGLDTIQLAANTTLAFLNQSAVSAPSDVYGASGVIMDLAGQGSVSITAGAGEEYFFVDTSVGNVTVNANPYSNDAITFVKDANTSTANIQVQNLGSGTIIAIHGYSGYNIAASATQPGSSVLALSDGSQVTFVGASTAAVQAVLRTE